MERSYDIKSTIIYLALKFTVIMFLGTVLYGIFDNPGFDNVFWNGFFQIVSVVGFILIIVLIFALSRHNFNIFGFFLVILASFFRIIQIALLSHKFIEVPVYLLVIAVSVYFMTKNDRRHKHGQIF